jgi:phosphatidylinositol alpha-1,6-mannosyltransferase
MRVLYLTPGCFDKGGISRYSRYQVAALREIMGPERVRVFSLLGPDGDSFEDAFESTWHGGGNGARWKTAFAARVAREAAQFRPHLVWSAHVALSALGSAVGAIWGASTVLNTYGMEVWSGFRWRDSWGLRRSHHVVSDCHWTARYLESEGLRPEGTVEVLWDCVDVERFCPGVPSESVLARYGVPSPGTGFNILTLGRMTSWTDHKGYTRLLEAFKRMAAEAPEARLIYGGRGELVGALRQQATAAGLERRVHFTGPIDERDLPDVYRSAHVFSLVSDRGPGRGEGIPLTPLEAAACGAPILVGNQDGSQEAVLPGVNGYVLDPFDLDGHAATLLRLARDRASRIAMAQAARRRIEEEFAYPLFRDKHRRLFRAWFPATEWGR